MATIAPSREKESARKPVVNFSRLRRGISSDGNVSSQQQQQQQENRKDSARCDDLKRPDLEDLIREAYNDDRNVHTIQAFYNSRDSDSLPSEPRFSVDSISFASQPGLEVVDISEDARTETDSTQENLPSTSPSISTDSDLRRNDTIPSESVATHQPRRPLSARAQRAAPPRGILKRTTSHTATSTSSSSTSATSLSTISRPTTNSSETTRPIFPLKSILKNTTVEQYSERASSEHGEDATSHHTVSEFSGSDRNGSVDSNTSGKWTSSDYDTSQLSEKEVKKLRKKGVNPALYLEMQAAKGAKGKKKGLGFGSLTGNAYVS